MPTSHLLPKPVSWSKDPIWVEIESDNISGGEATEPNLSLYMLIKKNNQFHTEFNSPYDLNTAKTDFDLSGVIGLQPEAPADGSMATFSQGICEKVTAMMELRYNDMYGNPVVKPSVLALNTGYIIIYGHTPYWFGNGLTGASTLLHSYYDMKGYTVFKELRKSQPEYVYLYSHDGASISMAVDVIYTDGSSTFAAGGTLTCEAGKVSWVNVGWDARGMDNIADPAKVVSSYTARFTIGGNDYTINYALDDHDTEYDEYILYDNGIGGCEVLRCSGRHTIGVQVDKQYTANARSRGSNYRDGFAHAYNVMGGEVWEMNTGWQNEFYIRHLGQLFLAERVWYMDRHRDKFVSVTVRQTSKTLVDKQSGLHSIDFTMTFDDRPAIGTFKI